MMNDIRFDQEFLIPVLTGAYDEYLDRMIEVIKQRKADKSPKIWEFQVGDKVRMKNANPKYLNGAEGRVVKVNRTKVVIDLYQCHGRFYTNITTPLTMIEKVN